MVFAAAREAGWLSPPASAEHVGFGSVLGPDGRMLAYPGRRARSSWSTCSTRRWPGRPRSWPRRTRTCGRRAGRAWRGRSASARSSTPTCPATGTGTTSSTGTGCSPLDGNTAPYLQYAHARIRSIFAKAGVAPARPGAGRARPSPAERALALELLALPGGGRRGGADAGVPPARRVPAPAGRRVHRVLRAVPGAEGRAGGAGQPAGAVRPDRADPRRGLDLLGIAAPSPM